MSPRYFDGDAFDPDSPEFEVRRFADPGGRSALYPASRRNPRNRPCPTCGRPNRLTAQDVAAGYQCNVCADRAEDGF